MTESEEMFDVVDEHNRVIDALPRSEVHRRGLRHRAVHVFVFRSDGRMLIHLRTDSKVEFPSVWTSSASGHVSSGEVADECAPRELLEELGIHCKLTYCLEVAACPETCMEFTRLYATVSDETIRPDPKEIADVRWLTVAEIQDELRVAPNLFSPAFYLLFHRFLESESDFVRETV